MEVAGRLLAGLNEGQRLVATSFGQPVCVIAGAGTGKTRAITHRIAYAVAEGLTPADAVLALTFTQKAAGELAQRLRALGADGVEARTFHSTALRQLQHFWPKLTGGYLPKIMPTKAAVLASALESLRLNVDAAVLRDLASEIEWRKVKGLTFEEYAQLREGQSLPAGLPLEQILEIHRRYEQFKDERRRIDFEDVLLLAVGMLEQEPSVADLVRSRVRHIVVDEYQDVSPIQQRLLDLWSENTEELCVVGDASQTIYSFAGATSDYLLRFADAYPQARIIRLEQNYRSSREIVEVANRVMRGEEGALELVSHWGVGVAPRVHAADSDEDEARWVADAIQAEIAQGVSPASMAVLHRFTAQMVLTEAALRQRGIPVRVQGQTRFFDQPHVARAVMEIRGAAVAGSGGEVVRVVTDILYGLGYTDQEPDHQGTERHHWEDFRALIDLAESSPGVTLQQFSEDLLTRSQAHDEPGRHQVTLSTVHSAKGLEWERVWLVGLTEGSFPISYALSPEAIAEERRLFYVAVTRAREQLTVSYASRGPSATAATRRPSRFLDALV